MTIASIRKRLDAHAAMVAATATTDFTKVSVLPSRFEIDQLVELRFNAHTMVALVLAVKFTGSKVLYDLGLYTGYTDQDAAGTHGLNNSLCWDENGQEMIRVLAVDSWFVHPHGDGVSTLLPVLENVDTQPLPEVEGDFQRVNHTKFDPNNVSSDAIGDASDTAQDNLTAMEPQSLEHSALDGHGTVVRQLTIEGTENAVQTLINLLAAIERNTQVGHSAVVGAFFDGDGHDKIRVLGLPANTGAEQANACSDYGDGLLALIGSNSAQVINERYITHEGEDVIAISRKTVWPKDEVETPPENPAPIEPADETTEPAAPSAADEAIE